ncbi:helical backbone metal receptor [Pseudobdellovibrio exovorus]|uniref:ABC-type Fe3+-siderophores transport system n=1 Tax=Pseudobdellovibrio exovorus JSS TaxID=1184267 RepID=M4V7M5_9BACT|nr:helical backbone metal receptor [Pseudobdellovibrio exovorus]AGH95218.1 ABC-type Fe3+-siderophores transport system [Pseudobdellovibrio exovorus JSS]
MLEKNAKILSLVPSWTETLIEAGIDVVGRTRFCIHPESKVKSIPAVGGTKNMQIDEILKLSPDLVVLDQEENKKEMAEVLTQNGIEIAVSHVTGLQEASDFLHNLGQRLQNPKLQEYAHRYRQILEKKEKINAELFWRQILIQDAELVAELSRKSIQELQLTPIEYVIWKNPFMVIGQGTFITEVMSLVGVHLSHPQKYPQIEASALKKAMCLFSSEPFPFAKYIHQLKAEGFQGALVDGEKISWYGWRNLTFLESCFN